MRARLCRDSSQSGQWSIDWVYLFVECMRCFRCCPRWCATVFQHPEAPHCCFVLFFSLHSTTLHIWTICFLVSTLCVLSIIFQNSLLFHHLCAMGWMFGRLRWQDKSEIRWKSSVYRVSLLVARCSSRYMIVYGSGRKPCVKLCMLYRTLMHSIAVVHFLCLHVDNTITPKRT